MTSLSAKIIASILIGVIIAGGAGYYYYTEYIVPQIEELQDAVDQLTSDYEDLTGEFNALTDEHEALNQQLQDLQDEHTELIGEKEELMSDYEALTEQYQQLQSEYETLLSDYEAAFGGLDISPETIPVLEKQYTWTWAGVERSINVIVPEQLYDYYSGKERYQSADYRGYILHPLDDMYVKALVYESTRVSTGKRGYSVCAFVSTSRRRRRPSTPVSPWRPWSTAAATARTQVSSWRRC